MVHTRTGHRSPFHVHSLFGFIFISSFLPSLPLARNSDLFFCLPFFLFMCYQFQLKFSRSLNWLICLFWINAMGSSGYHRKHLSHFKPNAEFVCFSNGHPQNENMATFTTLLSLSVSVWPSCIEHQIGYTWLLMPFILLKRLYRHTSSTYTTLNETQRERERKRKL